MHAAGALVGIAGVCADGQKMILQTNRLQCGECFDDDTRYFDGSMAMPRCETWPY